MTLGDETLKNQTKAVLLAELVSMELFYGLEDLLRLGPTGMAQGLTSSKLYSLTDKDLLLHSAETLLEVQWLPSRISFSIHCCIKTSLAHNLIIDHSHFLYGHLLS